MVYWVVEQYKYVSFNDYFLCAYLNNSYKTKFLQESKINVSIT
jgi:hypothetical protein